MKKYVPISKRTKKEQREFYATQRNTWDGVNPATKVFPNGKDYNRRNEKKETRKMITEEN